MSHNCNTCRFKQNLGYTHHIACSVLKQSKDPGLEVVAMQAVLLTGNCGSYVRMNPHGVKNGWATWPLNFDTIWVEECKLYMEKKDDNVVHQ